MDTGSRTAHPGAGKGFRRFLARLFILSLEGVLVAWLAIGPFAWVTDAGAGERTAFRFSDPGTGVTTAGTDGFQFTPPMDVIVTSLGYYDRGGDGLADTHPVMLLHLRTGLRVAFARVTERSMHRDNFRFQTIEPVLLRGGETYVIAAFTPGNGDPPADSPRDLIIAPEIGYQGYLFDFGESLSPPTRTDLFARRTFFGPNFEFHPAPQLLSRVDQTHPLRGGRWPSNGGSPFLTRARPGSGPRGLQKSRLP